MTDTTLGALGEGLIELRLDRGHDHVALGFGGDAANVCVMAARMGSPARLAGRVGSDGFGGRLLGFWRDTGVDVRWLRRDPAATGLYLNARTRDGAHHFTYWRDGSAGSRVEPSDVNDAFFNDLGVLVITGVTLSVSASSVSAAGYAAMRARERGVPVAFVLNHRPALEPDCELLRAWASVSDLLISSREDVEAVFGDDAPTVPTPSDGPREIVITAGADPATVMWEGGSARQDVPPTAIHDASGAGDALAGAYLSGRLAGLAPPAALRRGVAAASLSVSRPGCARSYPDAEATHAAASRLSPVVAP